jgi:hypothetical protein
MSLPLELGLSGKLQLTLVIVTESDKHSSLLLYRINDNCKMFYSNCNYKTSFELLKINILDDVPY